MKIKDLIKKLKEFDQNGKVFLASDEEMNMLYTDLEVENYNGNTDVVVWGNSGSEVD